MSDRIDLENVLQLAHYWSREWQVFDADEQPDFATAQLLAKAVQIMFPVVRAAFGYAQHMKGFENPVEDPHTQGVFLAKAMKSSQEIQDQVKIMLDSLASGTVPSGK